MAQTPDVALAFVGYSMPTSAFCVEESLPGAALHICLQQDS